MKVNSLYAFIASWVAPNSTEENLAARQYLLNITLLSLAAAGLVTGLIASLAALFTSTSLAGVIYTGFGIIPVAFIGLLLSRKGQVQVAAFIPPVFILLISILLNLRLGLGHFTVLLYPLTVMMAAVLINLWMGIGAAVISLLVHLIIGDLHSAGLLGEAPLPVESLGLDFFGLALATAALLGFIYLFRGQSRRMLLDAQVKNKLLDSQVLQLKETVEQSAQDLDRRLLQIRTTAEITSKVQGVLDQEMLIHEFVNLVRDRFGLYYVGVFLLDPRREYAILRAGTGEAGRKMVADGHKLAVSGDSMIGWCIANRRARIALDVGQDPVRFNNPYLWRTRSELALLIVHSDTVLGAMTVQSDHEAAFDEDDVLLLQGIADNLASALQNSQLFSQVQTNLLEIQSMHRQYLARAWGEVQKAYQEQLTYTFEQPVLPDAPFKVEIPLVLRDEVIGNLLLHTDQSALNTEERKLVEAVASQAALALENARLLQESQRWAERERTASYISSRVWASPDIETILRTTIHELGRSLRVAEGVIQLVVRQPETDVAAGIEQSPGNGSHGSEA